MWVNENRKKEDCASLVRPYTSTTKEETEGQKVRRKKERRDSGKTQFHETEDDKLFFSTF